MPEAIVAGIKYLAQKELVKQIAVSFAIGFFMQKLQPKPKEQVFKDGLKLNNTSNVAPIPVVYGRARIGGSEFRAVTGSNNENLLRCMVLCEGEIDSVDNVYLNDRLSTDSSLDGKVTLEVKLGEKNQTASSTMSAFSQWTSNFKGNGVAYLVAKLVYDKDVFASGLPTITADVKGKKVYDPRQDSTVTGGSGTHRQTTDARWSWSENPALCILDFLTNTVYGRSVPYADIDMASFIESANHCDDTALTLKDSAGNDVAGQKRYTCNGVVNSDEEAISTLRKLLSSCRGTLVVSDTYKLVIDKAETSVFTFDKTNIIGEWTIAGSGVRAFKNKIHARFFDKNNKYDEGISITTGTGFIAEDNNRVLQQDIELPFTNDQQRVDLLSQHLLKQSRLKWSVSFTATLEALALEAMDVVRIKHSSVGWDSGSLSTGKLFRISSIELLTSDTVKITAQEYDSSVYTFNVNTPPSAPSTNLPDPHRADSPLALTLDSTKYLINNDGTIVHRIEASWTPPAFAYVQFYEIAFKEDKDSSFSIIATNDTNFTISPVNSASNSADSNAQASGNYKVKVRAVYPSGKRSAFFPSDEGQLEAVSGKTTAPNPPKSFAYSQATDYTRQFTFVEPDDKDIKGFKIKYASGNQTAYSSMTALHSGLLTVSPFETKSIQAGTYKFSIVSVDTSGNESTPVNLFSTVVTDDPNVDILQAYYPRLLGWEDVGAISFGQVGEQDGDIISDPTSTDTWDQLGNTTWDNWETWGFQQNASVYYSFFQDFGTTLTFKPLIQVTGVGTILKAVKFKLVGGNSYTDLDGNNNLVDPDTVNNVTAIGIEVTVNATGANALIKTLGILLDGKVKTETLPNVDTSTLASSYIVGAGHIKIPLQSEFTQVNGIQVAFNGGGAGQSFEIVDKTSTVGGALAPTIKLYNSSGSLAHATIDITTTGF